MNLLKKIINAGTNEYNPKSSFAETSHLRLTNIINIAYILISITVIALILTLKNEGLKSYIRYVLLIPFCILNIILNWKHCHSTSKILTIFIPFFFIFLFPIFNGYIHEGMFIWFPYGIMISGSMSIFIFSFEKEKLLIHLSIFFFTAAAIFYHYILLYASPANLNLSFIYDKNYLYYQVSQIILALYIFSTLYIIKKIKQKNRQELEILNKLLSQKNQTLIQLNENLEEIVKNRTEKLDQQNKRIKNMAFVNSHEVRATVARIIGLINYLNEHSSGEEKEFCYANIRKSAMELDEVTDKFSKHLIEQK